MLGIPAIARVLGALLLLFSLTYAVPIGWALAIGDPSLQGFLIGALSTAAAGLLLWFPARRTARELQPRDGCLLVVLGWLAMAASACVPLMVAIPGLSFTHAFFEATAAVTTTGATVLSGLDRLPQPVNLWRCALQWYGGMAIIVLAVAILPLLGVGGMQLFRAETPGPMKEGKLAPRIAQTARNLWPVYVGLTAVCAVALRIAGMDWFDAICHAFSAVSLGGFSTRDASIAAFGSPAIEAVLAIFMLLSVLNFATHFLALRGRSMQPYLADPETRAIAVLVLGSCLMLTALLYSHGVYAEFGAALRHASFNAISIATTTGYVGADYGRWPAFAPMWMLFLCAVSSSAGSLGGGIKTVRALILVKQAGRELTRLIHPRAINPLAIGGSLLDNKVIFSVLGFMLFYGLTIGVLTLGLMATGLDLTSAISSVLACVNNTGPGLSLLGPVQHYDALTGLQAWMLAFAMLAGRLELLTVFVLFTAAFWRS